MEISFIPGDEPGLTTPPPLTDERSFADQLPETADQLDGETFAPSGTFADEGFAAAIKEETREAKAEQKEKRKRLSGKMKKTLKDFQEMFTDSIDGWFHSQALTSGHPEWELEEKDKSLIQNSIDFVFGALNIEVEIEPIDFKLESIWWVFLYPIMAFGFVFLRKKTKVEKAEAERAS